MKFDLSELQTWLQLFGATSLVALVTLAIKVWRWLTDPMRKKIVQLSQRQQGTRTELEKQAFEIRTKLTEDLRKFMELGQRIDNADSKIKKIEESCDEDADNLINSMNKIKEDFDILRDDIGKMRADLGSRISSIEGELIYIRTAITDAMKKG